MDIRRLFNALGGAILIAGVFILMYIPFYYITGKRHKIAVPIYIIFLLCLVCRNEIAWNTKYVFSSEATRTEMVQEAKNKRLLESIFENDYDFKNAKW
jgi:ABC-type transport system involved in cytochrome bd biosynthesis fused ATPase/permease subunit